MNKPTILLVSSDEVVQDRFTPALACLGYRVQNIHIGDEALLQLLQGGACLMVTELYVSSVAGDCLTQAVKEFSDTAHVPVICLGEQTQTDFRRALEAGADAFLPADVEPTALLATVEQLLARDAWRAETEETPDDDTADVPDDDSEDSTVPRSLALRAAIRRRDDIGSPR